MIARRLATACLALALAGCGLAAARAPTCRTDFDCSDYPGTVCFAEGCARPDVDLVAEVTGGALAGLHAQEIAVPRVGAVLDLDLKSALAIVGEFQRERSATPNPANRSTFTEPVVVTATGESLLLPGVSRAYEARITTTDRGVFSLPVGTGRYTVTASPDDTSIPPETIDDVVVSADGVSKNAGFAFAAQAGVITVQGRLLRKRTATADVAITEAPMDLQAFDPNTGKPISQRVEVSSGSAASRGDFTLSLSPGVKGLTKVSLLASPRRTGAMVPSKSFLLAYPLPAELVLEMGDFGTPIAGVMGRVYGPGAQPVAGAQVVLESVVAGNGQFRSRVVSTNGAGEFAVDLLPTESDQALFATVLPPPESPAGAWFGSVHMNGAMLTAPIEVPQRVAVSGTVTGPDGEVASGVGVRATFLSGFASKALPVGDFETTADADGKFTMNLDPGEWRVEFVPKAAPDQADWPRISRPLTVGVIDSQGRALRELSFAASFPPGRRVSGVVRAVSERGTTVVPNASVRLFRVPLVGGKAGTAALVCTALADELGRYSVVLPAAQR